jgi:hypothetical protein
MFETKYIQFNYYLTRGQIFLLSKGRRADDFWDIPTVNPLINNKMGEGD